MPRRLFCLGMHMNFLPVLYRKCITNYKIKLFSIFSALFFWVYVAIDSQYTHVTDIPLRLINPPEGFILLSPIPSTVRVEFKGTGKAFYSYAFRDRRVELDLHQISRSSWMPLSADVVKDLPVDLRPLRIVYPDSVYIEFDRFVRKKVPVHADVAVQPRDGFVQVGDVQVMPDSVGVAGPRSLVDAILEVETKKLDFKEMDGEFSGKAQLLLEHSGPLQYTEKVIRYKIDIQRLGERAIDRIPVQIRNLPQGMKINVVPSTLSLRLQGGVDVLSKLEPEDISAVVDYENRHTYFRNKCSAMIRLPKDIYFSDVQPKVFELIVEK